MSLWYCRDCKKEIEHRVMRCDTCQKKYIVIIREQRRKRKEYDTRRDKIVIRLILLFGGSLFSWTLFTRNFKPLLIIGGVGICSAMAIMISIIPGMVRYQRQMAKELDEWEKKKKE